MGFLAPEALIVARLEVYIALADWGTRRVPRVLTAADAANVEERSQLAPAYYVVLDNYAPTQVQGSGRVQQIEQQWVIYAVLRNAVKHDSGQGVRDDAHVLIDLAIAALCGFQMHTDFAPLSMIADTGPVYSDAGFGYFPIRFATRCVVRGADT